MKTHLSEHKSNKQLMKWIAAYDCSVKTPHNKTLIHEETLRIVKYFIKSDSAINDFDCSIFRDIFKDYKIKIPCSKTFKNVIIDDVYMKVKKEINSLSSSAFSICLISDIWTNKQMLDFMGVAAAVVKPNFEREFVVIELELMSGSHNA